MRFIVDKAYYFGNGNRFFDNELFKTSCGVTESDVLPILAIYQEEKENHENLSSQTYKVLGFKAFTFAKFGFC